MSWETVTLADIAANIQTGPFGSQLHQSDYSEYGVPVVMPKDLIDGHISESSIARVDETHVQRLNRHKIEDGDILYSRRGDVGRCAFAGSRETGWLCGTGCLRVTIDRNKANPRFVFYQLQKTETVGWVINHAVGATMLNLNTSILGGVPLEIPSLSQQNHIVEILTGYDSLIETNQRQIKLLEEAAQRLYKEWFVNLRYPGHENVPVVDGVPEGWERKTMADVCQAIGGGTPSTAKKEYYEGGTIRWVTPTDLTRTGSWILLDTEKKITKEGLDNSSAKMLPPYTVLMTSRASIGYIALCKHEVCTNQGFISCVPFDEKVRYYLMFNLLNRVDEIKSKATGSTFLEITKRTFKELEIIKPPEETISSFNTVIIPMINRMELLFQQTELLSTARDRLLPKLMSGEIAV